MSLLLPTISRRDLRKQKILCVSVSKRQARDKVLQDAERPQAATEKFTSLMAALFPGREQGRRTQDKENIMKATRTFAHCLLLGVFLVMLCMVTPKARAQNVSLVAVSAGSLYDGQAAVGTVYLTAPTSTGCWVTLGGGYLVGTTADTLGGRSGSPAEPRVAFFPSQVYIGPGQMAASFNIGTIGGLYAGWINVYAHYKTLSKRALIYMHP